MRIHFMLMIIIIIATMMPTHAQETAPIIPNPTVPYAVAYVIDNVTMIAPIILKDCNKTPTSIEANLTMYKVQNNKIFENNISLSVNVKSTGSTCVLIFLEYIKNENVSVAALLNIRLTYAEDNETIERLISIPVVIAQLPNLASLNESLYKLKNDINELNKTINELNKTINSSLNRIIEINSRVNNMNNSLLYINNILTNVSTMLDKSQKTIKNLSKNINDSLERTNILSNKFKSIIENIDQLNATVYNITEGVKGIQKFDLLSIVQIILTIVIIIIVGLIYVKVKEVPEILE